MKHKWPFIIIMWILYGTLEEFIPLLSHDLISMIPVIVTICLVFDFYPKSLFSKTHKLEKSLLKKMSLEKRIDINEHIHLFTNGNKFEDIDVVYDQERICSLKEFEERFPSKYDELLRAAINSETYVSKTVEKNKTFVQEKAVFEDLIREIDNYNVDILDEDISNGLYYCSNQLKYLQGLLIEYPQENSKIKKLKDYYLPILLDILKNYCKVSKTQEASALKKKLNQTLVLVNEAIRNITQSLFEHEKLNLNADMNVLESLLKKDGVIDGGMNKEQLKAYMEASHE